MDFARLWENARELWARPAGKLIFGVVGALIVLGVVASAWTMRPQTTTLGTFSAEDAPKVAKALAEKKFTASQKAGANGTFIFTLPSDQVDDARLALAEISLDPNTSVWAVDQWKTRTSWSNTDFDKRVNLKEQMESNITRGLMAMSVVDRARVGLTIPTTPVLFKEDIKEPKAAVNILPKKGQKLNDPNIVRGIMEYVAAQVEGLDPKNVTVFDASTSQVVSDQINKQQDPQVVQNQLRNDLLSIQQRYQEYWQSQLTSALEKVVGPGNVMVVVNPVINWDKVISQATEYKGAGPNGQGIVVSSQEQKETTDGTTGGGNGTLPAGTPSNSEQGGITYPGANPQGAGTLSSEKQSKVFNYLVNEVKTTTEKPGGGLESISVGVLVNSNKVTGGADTEQKVSAAVSVAMGSRAQVQVSAVPFVPSVFDEPQPKPESPIAGGGAPNLLWWVLGIGLGLGGVAAFFAFTKPRRPVLEPVFAGPEAAMMGGIPITEVDLPPPVAASVEAPEPQEKRLPESAEEVYALPPEEVAALADEFLHSLGVDPAKVRMKEKVEKIAKVQPDAVANLLRHWIQEEKE